jgi:hypothetical protein
MLVSVACGSLHERDRAEDPSCYDPTSRNPKFELFHKYNADSLNLLDVGIFVGPLDQNNFFANNVANHLNVPFCLDRSLASKLLTVDQ